MIEYLLFVLSRINIRTLSSRSLLSLRYIEKISKLTIIAVIIFTFLDKGNICYGSILVDYNEIYTPTDLITWWHCEGDTQDAVGRNDCDDNVLYDEGCLGQGWRFDSTHYISSSGYEVNSVDEITIEGWVKPDTLPLDTVMRFITIVGDSYDAKAVVRYDGYAGQGALHFYIGCDGKLYHIWDEDALSVGRFYHFTATYDGSYMRLYLNGEQVGQELVNRQMQQGVDISINSRDEPFYGVLDEVRIYGRALTKAEVSNIYQSYLAERPDLASSENWGVNEILNYINFDWNILLVLVVLVFCIAVAVIISRRSRSHIGRYHRLVR